MGMRMKSHVYKLVTPVAILIVYCLLCSCLAIVYVCRCVYSFAKNFLFCSLYVIWSFLLCAKQKLCRREWESEESFAQYILPRVLWLYFIFCTGVCCLLCAVWGLYMYKCSMSINGHFEFSQSFPFVKTRTKGAQIKMKSNGNKRRKFGRQQVGAVFIKSICSLSLSLSVSFSLFCSGCPFFLSNCTVHSRTALIKLDDFTAIWNDFIQFDFTWTVYIQCTLNG